MSDYCGFTNVSRSYEDAMQDALEGFDWVQEPKNYTNEPTTSVSFDEFKNSDERIAKFKSSLINPQGVGNPDSFFYSILYAL